MKRIYLIAVVLSVLGSVSYSQLKESWKVFDDSQIAVIEITVDSAALDYMYRYPQSDVAGICSIHFKNALIDEVIDSAGIRIRGNTSRQSSKKSFKLSINEYISGKKFYGLEKLNLNGEHNDPSIMRAKLSWDLAKMIGMPGSRAAHCAVYINKKFYGVYISVEHVDEQFLKWNFKDPSGNLWKCLYPADLSFKGTDPVLYKSGASGTRTYDLKTNTDTDDYSRLTHLINVLNNTQLAALPDSLEKALNVYEVLKYFAFDLLTGSWDDYRFLRNNYYLYHEPSADKFHWLPYDYDNTFGVDFFGIDWTSINPYTYGKSDRSPRPMAERVLQVPEYRNLFTHFMQFYLDNVFRLDSLDNHLTRLKDGINKYVLQDTYRIMDYGFSFDDYNNSYRETHFEKDPAKFGLREFIVKRGTSLRTQLNYNQNAKPFIYKISYSPVNPGPDDSIYVSASAFSHAGIKTISLNTYADGNTTTMDMHHTPVQKTKIAEEADRWTAVIPPLGVAKDAYFSITAEDNKSVSQKYPRGSEITIRTSVQDYAVVLNEILASNLTINTDENNQYEDWLELYNISSAAVDLSGKYLTDNPANTDKWEIPAGTILSPGGYLLVWCDEDSSQGAYHANFKLSADGEFLALVDNDGSTILDSLTFPPQTTDISYGRFPDGSANWQTLYPTPASGNSVTSVEGEVIIPQIFTLTAYPNPFNPSVNIAYSLPEVSDISIKIYDMLGKEIFSQKENNIAAGNHTFRWNAADYSTGTYICKIQAGSNTKTLKLLLLK